MPIKSKKEVKESTEKKKAGRPKKEDGSIETVNTKKSSSKKEEVAPVEVKKGNKLIDAVEMIDSKLNLEDKKDLTIERRLLALYTLQQIDSEIDRLRIVKGELPIEVQDIEDEIAGLNTRIANYSEEVSLKKLQITEKKDQIENSKVLIKKYEAQQMNVRNNREYESLTKEIEFQGLEIILAEKRIGEYELELEEKKQTISKAKKELSDRQEALQIKEKELNEISSEHEKDEKILLDKSEKYQKLIEERLVTAYSKIRKNARNGLAVVVIERDSCGGCFNKIPPQRQMEIKMHKKIIVCEYCGRILIDNNFIESVS